VFFTAILEKPKGPCIVNLLKMHYNFIEIGTSDFDTEIQTCSDSAIGLSVDPILHYLQRLPSKPHVMRILGAVSDSDGFADVYFVPPEIIERHGFPEWVRGCNSIGKPHPTVFNLLKNAGADPTAFIQKTQIPQFSMCSFLQMYQVSSCDYLKIDTEGHDVIILSNYIESIQKQITKPATRICFEANELTHSVLTDGIIALLMDIGYEVEKRDGSNIFMRFSK
jgi:hypothetical protein